ncbi:Putative ribonuclease H protein At1g65750 [Linum perenne]
MRKKLDGWKGNSLSFAGRVTLALSVLNSIPSYAMQTAVIPVATTNRIDDTIRNFIWGGSSVKTKTHLLSWDHICRSKAQGGLGLRKARELNQAYLMKLGWAILKDLDRLWVRVVTSKYLKEMDSGPRIRRKNWGSSLWKGIRSNWHEMREACQNSIRNGKDTNFWTTRWLDDDIRLEDYTKIALSEDERQIKVAEVSDGRGDWNWNYLRRYLPDNLVALVSGMEPPKDDEQDDELIWGPYPRGKFTLKLAYEMLDRSNDTSTCDLWKIVWKWEGPSRVKHFLWLVAHNRILTNSE